MESYPSSLFAVGASVGSRKSCWSKKKQTNTRTNLSIRSSASCVRIERLPMPGEERSGKVKARAKREARCKLVDVVFYGDNRRKRKHPKIVLQSGGWYRLHVPVNTAPKTMFHRYSKVKDAFPTSRNSYTHVFGICRSLRLARALYTYNLDVAPPVVVGLSLIFLLPSFLHAQYSLNRYE